MKKLLALTIAALALLIAGTALANVLIYKNGFGSRGDYRELDKLAGGKACKKSWKGKNSFEGHVKRGARECLFDTPVEGDRRQPNYTVQIDGKVTKKTHRRVRTKVWVGVAARANKRSNYEIRVFPKGRRYELLKNGATLEEGKNKAIAALNKRNRIRLSVDRGSVGARVNGKKVAAFEDGSPEEVRGRKTAIAFGNEARSKREGFVRVDRLKVFVPTP